MTLDDLRDDLRAFARERDWEQFHAPKNLSMALAGEAAELMEHFLWATPEASRAVAVVREAFARELGQGQIQSVESDPELAILAVVGDGMAGTHGVAAKVCSALGDTAVNIRAIAQGASERNISFVIDGRHSARALRAVHSGFYLSPNTISIGLIGPGVVGKVLLEQIDSQLTTLRGDANVDLRVRGIASSKRMLLVDGEIDLANWRTQFDRDAVPLDLDAFERNLAKMARLATEAGVVLGTPAYMSPEQARGEPVDGRADVWAFGCVLFEMLAGRPPFAADNLSALLFAIAHNPHQSITVVRPDLPPSVKRVLDQALQKDPALRFRRAGEFAQALRTCLHDQAA